MCAEKQPNGITVEITHGLRIVVVGSDGRLGRSLVGALRQRHSVEGIGRKAMDLASPAAISKALAPMAYDHLILTGALTGVDYCEINESEAFAINAEGAGIIADISAGKGAHVTYISTDMVFDGRKPDAYLETDRPNPISVYGASKLEGENKVLEVSPENLVARVSWVFGPARPAFPEWIIGQACSKSDLTLPKDKVACPTYTLDLVEWLQALLFGRPAGPAKGIVHLCNSGSCTWRDWGQLCIDTAREAGHPVMNGAIAGILLDSVEAFVAKRPANSALDTARFTRLTGIHPRPWTQAVREHVMQNMIPPK